MADERTPHTLVARPLERADAPLAPPRAAPPRPAFDRDSHWDAATKRTVLVILLVVAALIFWVSLPVLPILVIGSIIAYVLSPIVDICDRLRIPRGLSTLIIFLLLLVGLIVTPILLLPILLDQLRALTFDVPSTARAFVSWMQQSISSLPTTLDLLGFRIDISGLLDPFSGDPTQDVAFQLLPSPQEILAYINQAIGTAANLLNTSVTFGFNVVGSVFSVIFFLIFLFLISLYLTKDAPDIRAYVEGLFPEAYQSELAGLLRQVGGIWQAFFRGQIILSVTVGLMTWIALTIAGMPGALVLAILAGALEIIPNLGPILAMIPAVLVALIQGSDSAALQNMNHFTFALLTVGIYFIIQQLENNLLVPRIIGTSVNLHPVVVICGVVVGANLFGILGAFLAAPVVASMRIVAGYVYAKLLDYPVQLPLEPLLDNEASVEVYRRVVTGDEVDAPAPEAAQTQAVGSATEGTGAADIPHASLSLPDVQSAGRADPRPVSPASSGGGSHGQNGDGTAAVAPQISHPEAGSAQRDA